MIIERILEIIILKDILEDYSKNKYYKEFIDENYNIQKIQDRYLELGKEFLNKYALNKTEKSEEHDLQLNE